jgi:hypothetical protein
MIEGDFCDAVSEVVDFPTNLHRIFSQLLQVSSKVGGHYINIPWLTSQQEGCDGHPNVAGAIMMADLISPKISQVMSWY